jgi:hypothetical protein
VQRFIACLSGTAGFAAPACLRGPLSGDKISLLGLVNDTIPANWLRNEKHARNEIFQLERDFFLA